MTDKSGVIEALRNALANNPDDDSVRLHLADLLLESAQYPAAAAEYQQVLSKQPANMQALAGAARACREMGEDHKAQGYEKLHSALSAGEEAKSVENPFKQTPPPSNEENDQPPQPKASVTKLRVISNDEIEVEDWEDAEPPITLSDVGGMEHVKKRINMAFLAPLRNPEIMQMYGKSLRGGLMLYGPPGCGKTFIARALAGELGAKFFSVGMSDVLDMWLGESERKLHEIFESARRKAPCVLFFDEIDALGQKRSHMRHQGGRNIVNQLLAEMDSVGKDNKHVFVLGATNHPWDVDTALRRPGRFDRSVLVLPPDEAARQAILAMQLQNKPLEGVDIPRLAKQTDFFSGADLVHLCETAVEYAMHESLESGNPRPINGNDFDKAVKEVKPSTRPWFDTARNYAMFANEGGAYDDLLEYIKARRL